MNRKITGSTLLLSAAIITFSSYKTGPAHGGLGNRTGSSGSTNSCSMGCHGAESSLLLLTITLTDVTTGAAVTDNEYEPGHEYIVKLAGTYSGTTTYSHLGFQASVVNSSGASSGIIGATSSSTDMVTVGGLTLIEHINPIPKTGALYEASFKWTAPAAGSGDADFYARMVANNNNGISSDDTPNKIRVTFTEKPVTALTTQQVAQAVKLYPNPSGDVLNVTIEDVTIDSYQVIVRDMAAREIIYLNNAGNNDKPACKLDISRLAPGTYFVEINAGSKRVIRPFVKY